MEKKFTILCFFCILLVKASLGQDSNPPMPVAAYSMIGKLRYNLGEMMGQPFNAGNYANIRGSAFLIDSFTSAVVTLTNGKSYAVDKIRLNLYRNQVHFLTPDGQELVAMDGVVKRVYFFLTPDSSRPLVYASGYPDIAGATPFTYVEEMNQGDLVLLKVTSRTIVNDVGTSSSPLGQHFSDQLTYFLLNRKTNETMKWKKGKEFLEKSFPAEAHRIVRYTTEHDLACRTPEEAAEVLRYLSAKQ